MSTTTPSSRSLLTASSSAAGLSVDPSMDSRAGGGAVVAQSGSSNALKSCGDPGSADPGGDGRVEETPLAEEKSRFDNGDGSDGWVMPVNRPGTGTSSSLLGARTLLLPKKSSVEVDSRRFSREANGDASPTSEPATETLRDALADSTSSRDLAPPIGRAVLRR